MLPDNIFSLTITFDDQSADLVAVLTHAEDELGTCRAWSTTEAPAHRDNEWHNVRDLLIAFVQEAF